MKKELKLGKRLLSLALTLAVALTFTVASPLTSYATGESTTLTLSDTAVGTASSYNIDVLAIPTKSGGAPYDSYNISIDSNATFTVPNATAGMFSQTTGNMSSVTYTVKSNATATDVDAIKKDLSNITYSGEGTITIEAVPQQQPKDGDIYYEGHYYRLSSSATTWENAIYDSKNGTYGDTTTYKGYKSHQLTITSDGENAEIVKLLQKCNGTKRIWLAAVPTTTSNTAKYTNVVVKKSEDIKATVTAPGTFYSKGSNSWEWIYGTPEGHKTVTWKGNNQPSGYYDAYNKSNWDEQGNALETYVTYIGLDGSGNWYWDDLTLGEMAGIFNSSKGEYNESLNSAYYVIEYSPIKDDGNWLYSDEQNKVSATQSASAAESITSTKKYTATGTGKNIYHATVDFLSGSLTGLVPNTEYTLSATDKTTKTLTSDANGSIALWDDDETNGYDFTNASVTVKKSSGTIHSEAVAVAARKEASLTEDDVTKYSTKLVVAATKTSEYQYEYKIGDGDWVTDTDNDGKIVFDKLKSSTTYAIKARVKASSTVFASKTKSIDVKTLPKYGQTSATTEEENTVTKDLDTAKTEAKSDITKVASETYDTAEAAEVKAIKEQAEKDIAAATTVAEVNKIKAEAEAEIEAIPTAAEKAEKKAVQSITSKNLKAKSKKIKKNGKTAVKLTWNAPSGVKLDGYVIYRSTKKSTLGKKAYDTTTKTSYTNAKYLKKGNTYYYKVKGYKVINGEKVYTGTSTRAYQKIK